MKIGVFDSGVGGKSVANAIAQAMPEVEVAFRNDVEHIPYGTKPVEEIHGYVRPILQQLVDEGCEILVIACNTVSTTLAPRLREEFTVPIIALEPMVKPAAELTKTGVIAVCATPTTLASDRYQWLKDTYAKGVKVVEPDCKDWTAMIESKQIDHDHIAERINVALEQEADVIVLGCTHYHWIEEEIKALAGDKAVVLQPEPAVIKRLQQLLAAQ